MSRYVKLICVTGRNNNKFYELREVGSTCVATYGRIGSSSQTRTYPIGMFDRKLREKLKKGYKDVTEMQAIVETSVQFKDVEDADVNQLLSRLLAASSQSVGRNYMVSADAVTTAMIEEADRLMGRLSSLTKKGLNKEAFNEVLLELFTVIPRKMGQVSSYLLYEPDLERARQIVDFEQNTLDALRGQASVAQKTKHNVDEDKTLFEALGVTVRPATLEEQDVVLKMMGKNKGQLVKAFKVEAPTRRDRFDTFKQDQSSQDTQLIWHGSRTENWISILETGLVLRPSNAVISGKMYGYGLYGSDLCQKSIGYTSLRGAYWTNASANRGYMALYEMHTGNQLVVNRRTGEHGSMTWDRLRKKGDYHSLHAPSGTSVRNPETIVYREEQMTISYLIEISQ